MGDVRFSTMKEITNKFTIRDTMKVRNTSDITQYSIVDNHQVIKFTPGEIKEFPTSYIYMNKEGRYTVSKWYLEVVETLPDLLEEDDSILDRSEILDLRR